MPSEPAAVTSQAGQASETRATHELRALTIREAACVATSIVVADITLYRGHGYAGIAVMAIAGMVLLWIGKRRASQQRHYRWVVAALLTASALKLVWDGSVALSLFAGVLVSSFVVALEGHAPYVLETLAAPIKAVPAAAMACVSHRRASVARVPASAPRGRWLGVVLPAVVVAVFGTIFVMANPDLSGFVRRNGRLAWTRLSTAFQVFSIGELLFWLFIGALTLGLLQPLHERFWKPVWSAATMPAVKEPSEAEIAAYRNSLIAAIVLFAVYLVFEFRTLWFREFPEGFYYAGYAHQGAAWLTIALALTSAMLSVMFRASSAHADRLARLRPLAWIWSAENLLLAAAVYNRLWIYIQFNGMTRMRTIGLLGITAVVAGLLLMLRRLARGHGFYWLLQRYAWTVALAVLAYLLLPVDMLVHSYNVRRVVAGDLPPVVQVVAHPIDSSGVLVLPALLDSRNPVIRDGIRAMLAERHLTIREDVQQQRNLGWTAFQVSDAWLKQHLDRLGPRWSTLLDEPARRQRLIDRFREYAMQWY